MGQWAPLDSNLLGKALSWLSLRTLLRVHSTCRAWAAPFRVEQLFVDLPRCVGVVQLTAIARSVDLRPLRMIEFTAAESLGRDSIDAAALAFLLAQATRLTELKLQRVTVTSALAACAQTVSTLRLGYGVSVITALPPALRVLHTKRLSDVRDVAELCPLLEEIVVNDGDSLQYQKMNATMAKFATFPALRRVEFDFFDVQGMSEKCLQRFQRDCLLLQSSVEFRMSLLIDHEQPSLLHPLLRIHAIDLQLSGEFHLRALRFLAERSHLNTFSMTTASVVSRLGQSFAWPFLRSCFLECREHETLCDVMSTFNHCPVIELELSLQYTRGDKRAHDSVKDLHLPNLERLTLSHNAYLRGLEFADLPRLKYVQVSCGQIPEELTIPRTPHLCLRVGTLCAARFLALALQATEVQLQGRACSVLPAVWASCEPVTLPPIHAGRHRRALRAELQRRPNILNLDAVQK